MTREGFIEKGTKFFIYGIEWAYGKQMLGTDPRIGRDILTADDEYENHDGTLVVSKEKLNQVINEYVKTNFPKVKHYTYKTFDCDMNSITVAVK